MPEIMNKLEAVQVLENCKPVYQKLLKLPRYRLTCEDKTRLALVRLVYDAGLVDDEEVLEAAQLKYLDAAMLVGYVFSES